MADNTHADLAESQEPTWTTAEMQEEFEVLGFAMGMVVVRRKSDGKKGTLEFTHAPRVYYGWMEHQE